MTLTLDKPVTGNTKLVDYGIQNEGSDIRAHVCVNAKVVYVYPTSEGIAAIERGRYTPRPVYTGQIQTATGYAVPPSNINRCLPVNVKSLFVKYPINFSDSTSEKGRKAVQIVIDMLRIGYFPFFVAAEEVTDQNLQIEGTDIYVNARMKIQVKCDFEGGEPKRDGAKGERVTGNLFLQTAECNPWRRN
jgi:hypothetical protein